MRHIHIKRNAATLGLCAVLLISGVLTYADENNAKVGTRAFNFLKIAIGARPIAMGGAFTGVADDETALYYNPAGLAGLSGRHYIVGYHNYIFDMQSGFVGYIHPIGETHKLSVYINYLDYGEFVRADDDGMPDGTFSGSDMLFGVGYAHAINDQLSFGGTVKLIYEKIDGYSSSGAAADIGVKYLMGNQRTSFGLMVQNLGGQLSTFIEGSEKDPLPLLLRAGASSRLRGLPLLVAADVVVPTDNDLYFSLGAEYLEAKPLFLRIGWSSFGSNYKTGSNKDDLAGFSAGFGLDYRQMQISYTLTPHAELGTSHRITITGGLDGI